MRRRNLVIGISFLGVGFLLSPALAWWPLAHGLIAIDSGSTAGPGWHQAPDIWSSVSWEWTTLGVSDDFCWGHLNRRTYGNWPGRKLVQPSYYPTAGQQTDNNPYRHMSVLVSKLLEDNRHWTMQSLYIGFGAHNAEDMAGPAAQKTHFDLAPGALNPADVAKWLTHKGVETAIEKVAYVAICYAGDANVAFDTNGEPVGLPAPYDSIISAPTGCDASDGLLCLATKAFRKKQQTVDTVDPVGVNVRTREQIFQLRLHEIDLVLIEDALLGFTRADFGSAWIDLYGYYPLPPTVLEDPVWPEAPFWRLYYNAAVAAASLVW